MYTKQLKPGQICTIGKHVFRCKKGTTEYICGDCQKANKTGNCMFEPKPTFEQENMLSPQLICLSIFGIFNHPILVK